MIQLAMETSGTSGSLAIMSESEVLQTREFGTESRAAASFAEPLSEMLDELRVQTGQNPSLVSVAVGPGSFTGLRIAVSAAKTLAYAIGCKVIPVGSLAAMAAACTDRWHARSIPGSESVLVGLNAYRGQVFRAGYDLREICEPPSGFGRTDAADWIDRAEAIPRAGWEQEVHEAELAGRLTTYGEGPRSVPDAVGVGRVAASLVRTLGESAATISPFELNAHYLKPSSAEEKAAKR
ncbi:MAG: tRNA (adenosine(37)-N6)-threonylcarbamoyltransferase complex dimerization subunit type 1 TsaB [Planctomycetota bacterium]